VFAQSYSNWEYVIVDNCSTDQSLAVARRYAQRDRRVRIHTNQTFLKQFQNWNHALRQMAPDSDYCKVVHADDWLFPECLAQMVAVAEAHPTAGLVGAYRLEEQRVSLDGLSYPSPLTPGKVIGRRYLLEGLNVFGSPTGHLVRAKLVVQSRLFYDETILHADTDACLRLLQAHDFGFVHQVLTFTRRHNESMTAATHRWHTLRVAHLQLLLRHGRVFLTEAEWKGRLRQMLDHYDRFLGISLLEGKERAFWEFHRRQRAALGYPVRWNRVARAAGLELLNARAAWQHLRRRLATRTRRAPGPPGADTGAMLGSILSREP
jgi:glycosyltransferase involved in cell wall biosynthesis